MKPCAFPALLAFLVLAACGPAADQSRLSRFQEDSAEYRKVAYDYMWKVLRDSKAPVDSITVEGSKLHLRLSGELPDSLAHSLAQMNALAFNRFKRETLGYTGVSVYCISKTGVVAHAVVP